MHTVMVEGGGWGRASRAAGAATPSGHTVITCKCKVL